MKLVLISGSPAAGKTVIGQKIAGIFKYDFYSKDLIKEELFNSQPRTTYDYLWYEKKAKDKFFEKIKQAITQNKPTIVESNFNKQDKKRLITCLNKNTETVEIHCTARGMTRLKRYVRRNENRVRHKGHHDRRWYIPVMLGSLSSYLDVKWPYGPLNISSNKLNVDTTDFFGVDYKKIVEFIRRA